MADKDVKPEGLTRRDALRVLGASAGLAMIAPTVRLWRCLGTTACCSCGCLAQGSLPFLWNWLWNDDWCHRQKSRGCEGG